MQHARLESNEGEEEDRGDCPRRAHTSRRLETFPLPYPQEPSYFPAVVLTVWAID